jgi:hypothetical protein
LYHAIKTQQLTASNKEAACNLYKPPGWST